MSVQAGVRAGIQAGGRVRQQVDKFGGLAQGRARPRSGVRTFGFIGAAFARHPDNCNARGVFRETRLGEAHHIGHVWRGFAHIVMQRYKFRVGRPLVGLCVWRYMYLIPMMLLILPLLCLMEMLL